MEIEPKNQSRNFQSEKFVCSDFLAEWKTAFTYYGRLISGYKFSSYNKF